MNKKTKAVVGALSSAMGRETISKSRVSPKNDRSRRNILTAMILGLFLFSCGQKPNQETNNIYEIQQRQQQQRSSSKATDLRYYERIAGTWLSVETEQTNEYMMSVEAYETYYETGAYSMEGKLKMTYFNIENIGKVELNYTAVANGKYRIKNSVVSYDLDIHSFELIPQTYPAPNQIQQYMYDTLTEHLSAEIKKSFINDGMSDTIVEIKGNSMTYTDSKGKRNTRKKI